MFKRQIEHILKLEAKDKFQGVFPFDLLPKRQLGAYVINLDDHDEPGSHWVAVYDDGKMVEYFDSYGQPPTCLNFLGQTFQFSTVTLQPLLSQACGYYCCYFLIHRIQGFSMPDILQLLNRTDSHYVVKNYLYSRFSPVFK